MIVKAAAVAAIGFSVIFASSPPSPPTGLGATPGAGQVALNWNDNPEGDLDGYNVYRASTAGGSYVKLNSAALVEPSEYLDSTPVIGTPYFYVVRAVNQSAEESGSSGEVTATASGTDVTPPASPVITSPARRVKNHSPRTSGTAEPFATVEVFAGSTSLGTTAVAANGQWTHQNNSIQLDEGPHSFTAIAQDSVTSSLPSAAVIVHVDFTPPFPPPSLWMTPYNGVIDVEWAPSPSSDVAGYRVYRKIGSGSWQLLNSSQMVVGTRYRDSLLTNGTTYHYKVTAVDSAVLE